MPRIAFGGIQHETNTFAPSPATYADFEQPSGWPGLTTGAEIFAAVPNIFCGCHVPACRLVCVIAGYE